MIESVDIFYLSSALINIHQASKHGDTVGVS